MKLKIIEVYVKHYTENILEKHGEDRILSQEKYAKRLSADPEIASHYVKALMKFEVPEKLITISESDFLACVEAAKRSGDHETFDLMNTAELRIRVMMHAKFEASNPDHAEEVLK